MDLRIAKLKSTTFFGRRFTRRQIAQIQETVATFPALSRQELAQTLCEHLRWRTAAGKHRVGACLGLLGALEKAGILTLPPKREAKTHGPRKPLALTPRTDPQPHRSKTAWGCWLRCACNWRRAPSRRPCSTNTSSGITTWAIASRSAHTCAISCSTGYERPLGCLLFSQATRSLACRDAWVGWREGEYKQHLELVVGQPRFLLFPWVGVKNLASHALALAVKQLPQDWQRRYGCRPVLLETFRRIRSASAGSAIAPPTGSA